ncbi:MAG: DUF177 domain-containing protein [Clostridiales bacterium]|nr:DUF177 domain-containing protein [Candidatus Equinaster intestinalis]
MILDLRKAFSQDNYHQPIEYELDLSDISFGRVYPLKKPVKISANLDTKAGVVLLSIHSEACYEAPCDRCYEECAQVVTVDTEYILATELENEDNDDILLVADMEFNLDELCRTDVLLHIPMKHLCSPECKGLCAGCGKNLNRESCTCSKREIDPRLEALAKLLEQ